MKIIERADLNAQKWDALVERSGGTVFSCSFYLDAVAENWCVIADDSYTMGMALPYTIRAGQRTLYTPVFVRYLEWFGAEFKELESRLKKHFQRADICMRRAILGNGKELIYQEIVPGSAWKTNELTGRMLKKFARSGIENLPAEKPEKIMTLISSDLSKKVGSLDGKALDRLNKLVDTLGHKGLLQTITAVKRDEFLGGAFFIHFGDRLLYLKSAFKEEAKKSGVMYALMFDKINTSRERNSVFDFGGSRVPTVRQFNRNLGGADITYYHYTWDNSPFWFKMLVKLRQLLKGQKFSSAQKM